MRKLLFVILLLLVSSGCAGLEYAKYEQYAGTKSLESLVSLSLPALAGVALPDNATPEQMIAYVDAHARLYAALDGITITATLNQSAGTDQALTADIRAALRLMLAKEIGAGQAMDGGANEPD